ncbi:MAG: hypothetical protein JNL69_01470, partial [Bacteroidia bacterium]|nr:hypothetical protein [Bacteroidia bacterium]
MKYIATIFGFVFLSLPLFSQNYRSGDITYTHLSGNTYKISVRTFSNTFNTQNNNCELIINFGDGDTAIAYRINGASTICPGIAKDGQMLSFPTNTLYSLYEVVHTYNLSGNYLITTSYPTREYSVCNI